MPPRRPAQFDTLLRIRRRQEDLRAAALGAAHRDVRHAEGQRDAIADAQLHILHEAGERAHDVFDPREVRLYYQYERHLQTLSDNKDAEIVSLKKVAEERRVELEEAMKRRRMIEKLIERKMSAYEDEVRKEEQHLADETASNYASIVGRERLKRGGGPAMATSVSEPGDMEIG